MPISMATTRTSRVISFRGGPTKSTRINVYYTTGTVGTCLNHPKQGKTQLFRRGISSLNQLESIFDSPRIHTGEGYYQRLNVRQQWKKENTNEYLRDSARRWMYVGNATGLIKNEREMNTIVDICTIWDNLYWGPDDPPHIRETRFACGSHGGLVKMLYEIIRETYGDFQVCNYKESQKYHDGEIRKRDVDNELPYDHECANFAGFLERHEDDVRSLKHKFKSI